MLPEVTQTVIDGALGSAPANIDGVCVKLGVSSLGTPNLLYSFTRPQDVKDTLGQGPLVEAACHHLQVAGGPVLVMRILSAALGSSTVPVNTGGGPAVTLTGTPLDSYQGIARVVDGGIIGVATFELTLDGGDNWSPVIATAATYPVAGSGLTLAFAAGTYIAGATYTWTSTAPYYTLADLNTTFIALLADPSEWMFAHVVGRGTAAADSAAMAAAVELHMQGAATNYRYVASMIEAADDTDVNLKTAFASVSAPLTCVNAGPGELISSVSGSIYKRPFAWGVAARASKVAGKATVGIATHLGRVKDGSIPGYTMLYRDEYATPMLDALRFTTARTIIGQPGFFVTRGRMMANPGSDFQYWHDRMVINKACRVTRFVMIQELNDSVRTNADGTIYEADAGRIELACARALFDNMVSPQNVVRATAVLDRTINLTSTGRVLVDVRVRRRGYLEDIRTTIGFEAPNAQLAA